MSLLSDLAAEITACRACPTMPLDRRRVPGWGVDEPLVVLIGEAPGRYGADRTGVPFLGDRSGRFLRELMAEVGLSTERNAYITNVVKCNPRDERGNNRKPAPVECVACRGYLWRELALLRPRILVTLGDLACREVVGLAIRECVGDARQVAGYWLLPLYHPSYAASYAYPRERYREQFLRLRALLDVASA
jgi:uracil-DNA glycosylase